MNPFGMTGTATSPTEARSRCALRFGLAVAFVAGTQGVGVNQALAYTGTSYASIPGVAESGASDDYLKWLKIEGHYWVGERLRRLRFDATSPNMFNGPTAPREPNRQLAIAVSKRSPYLGKLMQMCREKAQIPELTFAESAELSRMVGEIGPIPAGVPEFYEYKLSNVVISTCSVDPGAVDQAFTLDYGTINLTNAEYKAIPNPLPVPELAPLDPGGRTRSFVLDWLAFAGWADPKQCPKMNVKPDEAEYYRLVEPAEAAKEKVENEKNGGVNYENGQMERRGPDRLNVAKLPTIVRDPGLVAPVGTVAIGVNLDGKAKQGDYVSHDGRAGIDNRRFQVHGCINTYQGHNGYYYQYQNEQRRNKRDSLLIQISGIDDDLNDDRVQVTIVPSQDAIMKSADGAKVLPNYTFRVASDPTHKFYAMRLTGRIKDGIITTDPVDFVRFQSGTEINFNQGSFRLQILPDGHLKGIVAGYEDIRSLYLLAAASNQEQLYGLSTPGLYYAFRRAADGLQDPRTGEYWGVSSAYEFEATPAFISPTGSPFAMAPETTRLSAR